MSFFACLIIDTYVTFYKNGDKEFELFMANCLAKVVRERNAMKLQHIFLLGLWLIFIVIATFLAMETTQGHHDFNVYHYNADQMVDGVSLYAGYPDHLPYLYPPLLAQGIAPFTSVFEFRTISFGWHLLSIGFLAVSTALINQTVDDEKRRWVFWLMPVIFTPSYQSLWVGQISMLMLICLTGAWLAYKHDRPYITGGLLALATWIKIYPIFLIVYFIWKRDWKVTVSAFVIGVGLLFAQILMGDVAMLTTYFTEVLPGLANEGQINGLFKNSSILGFTYKLFIETEQIIPIVHNPTLASISRAIITLLVVGGAIFLVAQPKRLEEKPANDARFDLEYGLVMLVALLFASTLWVSGMPQLLLCYQLMLKQRLSKNMRRLVWISFAIVSYYFIYLLAFQPGNRLSGVVLSMGFYGLFLLWGLYILQLWRNIRMRNSGMSTLKQ